MIMRLIMVLLVEDTLEWFN